MKSKHLFLGLVTGAMLSLATGCSKQESSVAPANDSASKNPAPAAAEKPQPLHEPNQAGSQSAANTRQETVVTNNPTPTSDVSAKSSAPVLSDSASTPPAVQPQTSTTDQSAVKPAVASAADTSGTIGSAVSNTLQSQQQALAQSATNQFQTMAAAATNKALAALGMTNQAVASATNQFQTMAAAATNKALAALGMTNQALASGTNQVQALLDQARTLTANQKYQDALGYVTQLYNTKLTPDQKQQVDALKAQIQSGMAQKAESEASSVLGGFLGGKK